MKIIAQGTIEVATGSAAQITTDERAGDVLRLVAKDYADGAEPNTRTIAIGDENIAVGDPGLSPGEEVRYTSVNGKLVRPSQFYAIAPVAGQKLTWILLRALILMLAMSPAAAKAADVYPWFKNDTVSPATSVRVSANHPLPVSGTVSITAPASIAITAPELAVHIDNAPTVMIGGNAQGTGPLSVQSVNALLPASTVATDCTGTSSTTSVSQYQIYRIATDHDIYFTSGALATTDTTPLYAKEPELYLSLTTQFSCIAVSTTGNVRLTPVWNP